ncbi:MAG: hypothetical protein ACT4QE_16635 [Anaerolineales bacterium]
MAVSCSFVAVASAGAGVWVDVGSGLTTAEAVGNGDGVAGSGGAAEGSAVGGETLCVPLKRMAEPSAVQAAIHAASISIATRRIDFIARPDFSS